MSNALIGYSGFVGSTLLKQASFDALYRSTTIGQMRQREFDTVVCAGAPAQKWLANRDPAQDRHTIEQLIDVLSTVKCRTFILISTVDVFSDPVGVSESTPVNEQNLQAYGLHRRWLEHFVERQFASRLIVRLPGLVGPGLRKNIIFDFLNKNNLQAIDSRSVFQFYPMVNLWYDIQIALQAGLSLVHLTAQPLSVADVARQGFGLPFTQALSSPCARYDMRTEYAHLWQSSLSGYQYSMRETLQAVRAYAQSEPLTQAASGSGQAV